MCLSAAHPGSQTEECKPAKQSGDWVVRVLCVCVCVCVLGGGGAGGSVSLLAAGACVG